VAAAFSDRSGKHGSGDRVAGESCRNSGVADFVVVKIYHVQAFAMFGFTFTEIMQIRLPLVVLLEIFCSMLRDQNVTGVTAIHDALGDVNPGAGNIRLLV